MPIDVAVPGRAVGNAHGSCYLTTAYHTEDQVHAGERLTAALTACTDSLAALAGDRRLSALDLTRTAFLDTETTGLGGGVGTYAFLIGVGRFVPVPVPGQGSSRQTNQAPSPGNGAGATPAGSLTGLTGTPAGYTFELRQYFMRHPGEERAQLAEVADWVADCTGLVTFNGRCFDMPLLATRYALHRFAPLLPVPLHLDLLPLARRLWRGRLPSCALVSLERHILGLERMDDVPGWLIPERYLRYQRDGDARPLVGIIQHNALDILSMVSLLTRVARAYRVPAEALDHGRDWLSLAKAYESAGEMERVIDACEGAIERGLPPADADEAFRFLAAAARRLGDWDRAVAVWSDLAAAEAPRRLFPFEELAKYYEHRALDRDYPRALQITERARALIAGGVLHPPRGRRVALAELDQRAARLRKKVARDEG